MVRLQFPTYIWSILNNWYYDLSSSVLWYAQTSDSFPVRQGVFQGAVLSPLLYSIFVNDLLAQLQSSGFGLSINNTYFGALMYADNLALLSNSCFMLQAMLSITYDYAIRWRYSFNAAKSAVLVFGESPPARARNCLQGSWYIATDHIPQCDSYRHLGILRLVSTSNLGCISERCSAGRSAFYALNAVGSRFGCLHPSTSLQLYSSFCLPIYGCKIWSLTKTELSMLERSHRKILRTIIGLPTRCPHQALQFITGFPSIVTLVQQR